jgi:uncharacterized membrane protein
VNVDLDRAIARLLTAGTYLGVALLAVGVLGMITAGTSPFDTTFPGFDATRLPSDLTALRPAGFLWSGLLVIIATPVIRVAAALVAFLRAGDRRMALISAGILAVIALGVVLGVGEG